MRWVRPGFTTWSSSPAFRDSDPDRCSRAGTRSCTTAAVAARCSADGKVSLLDCEALTWSFGCTRSPRAADASAATTSLTFMFVDVPDPVWNTSMGKCSSCSPAATSSAACATAAARSPSSTPSRALTRAADALIRARAWTTSGSIPSPEIGKFSTARWVCAPQSALAGTRTSPMVSCSTRYPSACSVLSTLMRVIVARRAAGGEPGPLERGRGADLGQVPPGLDHVHLSLHQPVDQPDDGAPALPDGGG